MSKSKKHGSAKNIRGMWEMSHIHERRDQWYPTAKAACEDIGEELGVPGFIVAGVVAALSPRNQWERNVTDAFNLCRVATVGGTDEDLMEVPVCTFNANKAKAIKVLHATSKEEVMEILNGPKLQEFYSCILGSETEVCIDGHAFAVWMGERIPVSKTGTIGKRLREQIKADYRKVADEVGVSPCVVQSTTWLAYKRIHGI